MIDIAHQRPCVAVVPDMPPPGQSFIAHAHIPLCRTLAKFGQIIDHPVSVIRCQRRTVRAQQHQIGAKLRHDIELALHPVKRACPLLGRHPFQIAKRLEQGALHPKIADRVTDIARRSREGQQVVFENLDTVKTRRRRPRGACPPASRLSKPSLSNSSSPRLSLTLAVMFMYQFVHKRNLNSRGWWCRLFACLSYLIPASRAENTSATPGGWSALRRILSASRTSSV